MDTEELDLEIHRRIRELADADREPVDSERRVQELTWQETFQQPRLDNLDRLIPDWRNQVVLDLGCGLGGLIVAAERAGGSPVGIDFNLDYLRVAALRGRRYNQDVNLVAASGEELPIRDQSVDVLICYEVLEHVFKASVVLDEIRRIVQPNGRILVTIHNRFGGYDYHYHLWGINWLPRWLAERLLALMKRAKNDHRRAGVQKLSEMNYFSYRSFRRECRQRGLVVRDIAEDKLLDKVNDSSVLGITLNVLKRIGMLRMCYRFYRATFMSVWHLMLVRQECLFSATDGKLSDRRRIGST